MYTEEEAKGKWCFQSMAGGSYWKKCVASECMAWRWIRGTELMALELVRKEDNLKVGYCGIAGKP